MPNYARRPYWRTSNNIRSDNESKKRYLEKIKEIDEIDPYSLKKKDFSANYEDFPSIGYPDIVNYLLFSPSPVTKEDLKNYTCSCYKKERKDK